MDEAQAMVRDLFACYLREPSRLPQAYATQPDLPRAIADYIAGMTDRFAQLKWREIQSAD
jgi:dGTPase